MNKRCVFANSKGSGSLFVERAGHEQDETLFSKALGQIWRALVTVFRGNFSRLHRPSAVCIVL